MVSGVNANIAQSDVLLRSAATEEDVELRGEMRVGREQDCEIRVDDHHISRYHAKISVTEEGILLEDLRSTNGTYVNGIRIKSPQLVSVGDELRFHHCLFRLVSNQSANMDATVFGWPVNTELAPPVSVPELDLDTRTPSRPSPAIGAIVPRKGSEAANGPEEEFDSLLDDPMPELEFEAEDLLVTDVLEDVPPPQRKPRPPDRPSAIERQMRKEQHEREDFLQRVADLPIGVWMALTDEDHAEHALCKLAGRSRDGSTLHFVSDSGMRVIAKSSRDLAKDLQFNRAYPLDRGPLLGRLAIKLTGAERRARNSLLTS